MWTVRAGQARVCAREDAHNRRFHGGRQMQRARVIGDEKVRLLARAASWRSVVLPVRSSTGSGAVARRSAVASGVSTAAPTQTSPAPNSEAARRPISAKCSAGQRFVIHRRRD